MTSDSNPATSGLIRQQLECTWQRQPRRQTQRQVLQTWLQAAIAKLAPSNAPRVTEVMTPTGLRWKVEDPQGNGTHWFDQAAEVRVWLEQRYYRD